MMPSRTSFENENKNGPMGLNPGAGSGRLDVGSALINRRSGDKTGVGVASACVKL